MDDRGLRIDFGRWSMEDREVRIEDYLLVRALVFIHPLSSILNSQSSIFTLPGADRPLKT